MFTTSLKTSREVYVFPPTLWPRYPTFLAYKLIWEVGPLFYTYPVYIYVKNSFIITVVTMIIGIPMIALASYGVSKLIHPRWSRFLFLIFIGTMMVGGQVALIPNCLMMKHFPFPFSVPHIPFTNTRFPTHNFLDTYWAVILPGLYSAFSFLLFKGFFDTIPDELINAARLDGASEIGIFRRIVLPLSKPIFAVVSYFTFSGIWNSFLWPMLMLRKEKMWPLSVLLYNFQYYIFEAPPTARSAEADEAIRAGISFSGLMAVSIIQSVPVFIMFLIFREYLMTGIKIRGFK